MTAPWWRDAVGYEIYLRSFADSDGDGVGDLGGVIAHLDHLQWLGVDALWITPWYPSPQRDHGYDVADYRAIDPRFGTLADVDRLIAEANGRGLRVIADMVPNHTAAEHAWFQAALADPTGPYRDYYIWRDGLPGADGEPGARPPNNWLSHFGGPAWTRDPASGQWWLHLFLPEQPDLNWANPKVREEFDAILEFWVDRGVDGFRLDVAHGLAKHPELLDNPPKAPDALRAHRDEHAGAFDAMDHVHDLDQDAVVEVHRGWRRVTAPRGALLLGEAYLLDAPRLRRYVDPHEGLDLVFWFPPLHVAWDAATVRQVLEAGTVLGRDAVAWITGSHDRPRAATRLGNKQRALALSTLVLFLPGAAFLYQGEELGLADAPPPAGARQDPVAVLNPGLAGRDGCRTPLPWAPGPGWGFTTAPESWLPYGDRTPADTVAVQREDPTSTLHRYRWLLGLRRSLLAELPDAVEWLDLGPDVVAYRRGPIVVAANAGTQRVKLEWGWLDPDTAGVFRDR